MAGKSKKKEKSWKDSKITWFLIVLNVLVFLIVFSAPEQVRKGAFERYSLSQATATQVWRWVTSMFLHASASHLFFNMLGLYIFGRLVEEKVRPQWFLAIYFVGGFLGSLAFLFTSPAAVVGASAGIFSLLGAAMLLNPPQKVNIFVFPLPLSLVGAMYVISESFAAYYLPGFGNVAYIAHVGGLITGAVFAFAYDPKQAFKGVLMLLLMVAILFILAPILSFATGAGSIILGIVDFVVGIVLYGLAWLLSFLWY
jgi:membrane associated rhomboid family serine protease